MTKNKWQEIQKAKKILGLEDTVSRADLKRIYRRLSKRFHPDTPAEADTQKNSKRFQEIAMAYKIIMEYCDHFPVSLTPDENSPMSAEEWWMDRFGHDPLWGKARNNED